MSTSWQSLLFVSVLVGLFASPVTATSQIDKFSPATRELIGMSVTPETDLSLPGRRKFVRVVATYCREVLAALPTNTPREDDWVAAEMKTTDVAKVGRLTSSP